MQRKANDLRPLWLMVLVLLVSMGFLVSQPCAEQDGSLRECLKERLLQRQQARSESQSDTHAPAPAG